MLRLLQSCGAPIGVSPACAKPATVANKPVAKMQAETCGIRIVMIFTPL
ncbi:MAG: hypothetical protein KGL91_05830 [Xanthomonadaceae bacterium]|nr:hypothetical protein [Xanthomonadaceae bacterium]